MYTSNYNLLLHIVALLRDYFSKPDPGASGKLYMIALTCLGVDASPNDIAPDEYGCAETVNAIHTRAFGAPIGGDVSTYRLYSAIRVHSRFIGSDTPRRGDIVLSPSGYGNGKLSNGHVGIVGDNGVIMSNDSKTGLFTENFTLDSWRKRYVDLGGYPMLFFRRV